MQLIGGPALRHLVGQVLCHIPHHVHADKPIQSMGFPAVVRNVASYPTRIFLPSDSLVQGTGHRIKLYFYLLYEPQMATAYTDIVNVTCNR